MSSVIAMANTPSEKALRRSVPELNTAAGSFAKVSVCVVIRVDGITVPVPALPESAQRQARHPGAAGPIPESSNQDGKTVAEAARVTRTTHLGRPSRRCRPQALGL